MPYISFEEVERLASIEQLAEMLGLNAKKSGRQLRCSCPVHGGDERTLAITPDVKSKRGSEGVFFCQAGKSGGDRIGLVAHCMDIGQQDAAFFIQEQYGTGNSTVVAKDVPKATVPQNRRAEPTASQFDPAKFAAKLEFSDEVAALGIGEDDAVRIGLGWHPQRKQIYFALRDEYGFITGFVGVKGELKMPPKLIPNPSVVKLKRA
jgi:hypothetical protein